MWKRTIAVTFFSLACIREQPAQQVQPEPATTAPVHAVNVPSAPSANAPAPGTPAQPAAPTAVAAPALAQAPSAAAQHFGGAMTVNETTPLADLLRNPQQFAGRTVRTTGTVAAVCQAMGCWMEIRDENSPQVHIRMAGHAFFIPRDARGRRASVQATVQPTQARNTHCEDEAEAHNGVQVASVELLASGVDLL